MVVLILLLQSTEDGDGAGFIGLVDHDHLEAAFQGLILLEVLLILVKGRGTDGAQFATRQGRLEDVSSIHRTFALTSPYEGMDLIDEEDDFPFALGDFADDRFETFFKFALVLRTSDEGSHIERIDLLGAEVLRDIPTDDTEGKAFGDSGLPHPRFPDEDRVILRAAREDLQHTADLVVTSDDGVELASARPFAEVDGVLAEGIVLLLGVLAGDVVALTELVNSLAEVSLLQTEVALQKASGRTIDLSQGEEEVLEGNIFILHLRGDVLSLVQDLRSITAEVGLTARDLREGSELSLEAFLQTGTLDTELREEEVGETISERQETGEQVLWLDGLIAALASKLDRALQGFLRLDGILIYVHCLY